MSAALAKLRVVPVENESSASINSRLSRRAYLAPETLRSLKLVAGEWVHLNPTGNDERTAEMGIISQLWPRSSLEEDGELRRSQHPTPADPRGQRLHSPTVNW